MLATPALTPGPSHLLTFSPSHLLTCHLPTSSPSNRIPMNAPHPQWPAIATPAQNFIGNRWHAPATGAELSMVDPSDGAPFAAIARGNAADVDAAVRAAQEARAGAWGKLAPAERGRLLGALSRAILDRAEELALIEARDCGKPLKLS